MNTDFFILPNIDDRFSTWKLIVGYENNGELVLSIIAYSVTIEE